jgi:transaldolase
MKIFLDTADTEVIKEHFETGLIDGITTNPTLIRKSGRDPEDVYQELVDLGIQDISMEVVGDAQTMLNEGLRLSEKFGSVATIKLPCDRNGLRVCHELTKEKIRTNVTLVFSPSQAILASKAGATYVSPFVGRLNDNSFSGVELVRAIAGVYSTHGVATQVLAASLRDCHHVSRCLLYGANIVTLPPAVFLKMYDHVLTREGLEIFNRDWALVNSPQDV